VWVYDEYIYFFIQMQQPYFIFYAIAELIGDEWKIQQIP
jgi:hypothetical protein